jgi:drug/metabolite transporter (DMT)-like permease
MFQVIGLDRTSEAVSAFLTSLTVVVVPITLTVVLRQPPRAGMWIAVALAALGIWLMTGASPTGFGVGEAFGLVCGILFSAHILVLDRVMRRESTPRMALAQFAVGGVGALLVCPFLPDGMGALTPTSMERLLSHGADSLSLPGTSLWATGSVAVNLVAAAVVSTLLAFALIFTYQPRLSPTRAAIVYLFEPIFASIFAYLTVGRTLAPIALIGGGLILVANLVAEVVTRRGDGVDSTGAETASIVEE